MIDPDLVDRIADAVAQCLKPTISDQLRRHQERVSRVWLTPPQAARLAGCHQ